MAKFFGAVGYGVSQEIPEGSGVWRDVITEYQARGDIITDSRSRQGTEYQNDSINLTNKISIIGDQYAIEHYANIKYVKLAGVYWNVSTIEVQSPRLLLTLGGVYNGTTA